MKDLVLWLLAINLGLGLLFQLGWVTYMGVIWYRANKKSTKYE